MHDYCDAHWQAMHCDVTRGGRGGRERLRSRGTCRMQVQLRTQPGKSTAECFAPRGVAGRPREVLGQYFDAIHSRSRDYGSLGATMIALLCGRGCMRRAAAEWAGLRQGPTNGG